MLGSGATRASSVSASLYPYPYPYSYPYPYPKPNPTPNQGIPLVITPVAASPFDIPENETIVAFADQAP